MKSNFLENIVSFITKYFGWRNWAVLVYNSVFENIFLLFYIALRLQPGFSSFIIDFLIFLLFSSLCTSYGYLVNDLGDKELDSLHGKSNTFQDDSDIKARTIVLSFLVLSGLCSINFIGNKFFLPLWFCWIFLATAYSLKPFRLKEKGTVGLISVVIAQRILPTLLIFSAFQYYDLTDIVFFTLYIFFRGLSSDLNHQLEDFHKDLQTATDTYAVKAGATKVQKILRLSLESEKILLIPCLILISIKLFPLDYRGFSLVLPLLLVYLILYGLNRRTIKTQGADQDVNPFTPGRKDIFQFIHHTFPSIILPFYLILLLVYTQWLYLIILLFIIVYRKMYSLELLKNSFPVRAICRMAGKYNE